MRHVSTSHVVAVDRPQQGLTPMESILIKFEEVDSYTDIATKQYPKYERHLLAAETRGAIANVHRLLITAWKRYHKKTTLSELDIEVELLRHLVRKALRKKYINTHRYQVWTAHLNELGAMLGGWIKSINTKQH